jgi:hypothetical protein
MFSSMYYSVVVFPKNSLRIEFVIRNPHAAYPYFEIFTLKTQNFQIKFKKRIRTDVEIFYKTMFVPKEPE